MMCEAIKEMRRLSREEGREEERADSARAFVAAMRLQGIGEESIQAVVATVEAGRSLSVDPSEN